jgi:hypothetical protein
MANFAGFDRSAYPGDTLMQAIKQNTNLQWCGFYLAPAPSHPDTSWMSKRSLLRGLGFGLAPVYVGQQSTGRGSHILTGPQGAIDGQDAADLATAAGFAPASIIFLDVEQGGGPEPKTKQYYQAWVAALVDAGFSPGIYCSHSQTADSLRRLDNRPVFWVFDLRHFTCDQNAATARKMLVSQDPPFPTPDPSSSGVPFARLLQFTQTLGSAGPQCVIKAGDRVLSGVDFDSSVAADPSDPASYPHS